LVAHTLLTPHVVPFACFVVALQFELKSQVCPLPQPVPIKTGVQVPVKLCPTWQE
jgi:hypothetical protein